MRTPPCTYSVCSGDSPRTRASGVALRDALIVRLARRNDLGGDQVPGDVLENERRIAEATAREEGKPEQVLPRIVEGRINGFYKDVVLLDQPSVSDSKKTVKALLDSVERTKPSRVVLDSLSEIRLLAQSTLRYRKHVNGRGLIAHGAKVHPSAIVEAGAYVEPGVQIAVDPDEELVRWRHLVPTREERDDRDHCEQRAEACARRSGDGLAGRAAQRRDRRRDR